MRVIIYVPSVRGQDRTRWAVARDADRLGHDIAGFATTADDARWGLDEWKADKIAGRDRHLLRLVQDAPDLADRIVVVHPNARAVLLVPLGWLVWLRRHPRTTAVGVAAAVLVTALAVGHDRPYEAMPPPPVEAGPSVNPATSPAPTSPPPESRHPTEPPAQTRHPESSLEASEPGGAGGGEPAPSTRPASPPPSRSSPPTVAEPTPTPATDTARCVIDLRIPLLKAKVCLNRSGD